MLQAINSARNDSAGLTIPERMAVQIRGLNQATRNANDGISLVQTVEGVFGEIGNDLQRLRKLVDGAFRVLVDGKHRTHSLPPQAAKVGNTFDLVVPSGTPKTNVIVPASAIEASAQGSLASPSRSGQLIGDLLASNQGVLQPALLGRGKPLLPIANKAGFGVLAQLLQQAIAESGLFYESHQACWLDGQHPKEALLREPHGLHSRLPAAMTQNTPVTPARNTTPGAATLAIPADLVPLVQQQLDALTGNPLLWQGQIWPGQMMQWQIDQPHDENADAATNEPQPWRTTLRLTLPWLGTLGATLSLTANGVVIAITADSMSIADLRGSQHNLERTLAAAVVPLLGFKIERHKPAEPMEARATAVALAYDAGEAAPRAVAKEYYQIAGEIIARAHQQGVYVHESPELVALLMRVDLDAHIPPQLYIAVTELLAWLYRLERAAD